VLTTIQRGVYQFEGSINKISVDDKGASVLIVFGLPPLSHEDDPDRALLAATTIKSMLSELSITASSGVASGAVFAGVIGAANRKEYTVMGDTVNLAARFMMAAKGGVLCDETTRKGVRRGVRGLNLEALEPMKLKGKAAPVPVFRVSQSADESRAESHGTNAVPLIGRKAERAEILSMISSVASGSRQIALIEGEAGIGKSRLVEFAMEAAREADLEPLWGTGEAVDQRSPYRSWRPVVRSLLSLPAYPGTEGKQGERETVLHALGEHRDKAALLNDIINLDFPETAATKDLAGTARMGALRQLVLTLLQSREKPYCVVIEDLHWIDSSSVGMIEALRQSTVPVLLLLTTRPLLGSHHHPELVALRGDKALKTILLETLEPEEAIELVTRRLGLKKLSSGVQKMITDLAQGHPFFSEELAYAIRDAGVPLESEAPGALPNLSLPRTVEGVITSRVDKLPPAQQLTLKVASVIGRIFPLETVDAIHPAEGDRSDLTKQLTSLDSLQLTPLETPAPTLAYIFKHPVTHDVVYNLVLFGQRRELHQRAADWYEKQLESGQPGQESVIAYHLLKSWDPKQGTKEQFTRVLSALQRAGDRAIRASAYPEAIKQFEDALALVKERGGSDFEYKELEILLQLGTAFLAVRGYSSPEVEATYARAKVLAAKAGEARPEFTALRGLWAFHTARGEYHEARKLAERMLELANGMKDEALLLETHRSLGNTYFWLGDFDRSTREMELTIATYDEKRDRELGYEFGQDPGVACMGMVAWPLAMMNRFEEAHKRGKDALELAERLEHPYSKGYALLHKACTFQFQNKPEEALKFAEEVVGLSSALGFPNWLLGGLMIKGWCLSMLGKPADGAPLLEQMLGTWRGVGCGLAVPYFLTLLGECLLKLGKPAEAKAKLEEATKLAEQTGEIWYQKRTDELLKQAS
jgi:tetratricopeptide (TPR) repeat protein